MEINNKQIGIRIREHRVRLHIRQDTLAWEAEISAPYLSSIENGRKPVSLGSMARIARALSVPIEYLLFGEMAGDVDRDFQELSAVLNGCEEIQQRIIMDAVLGTAQALKRSLNTNGF